MQRPSIKVKFPEPRDGYWDGGKKRGGEFTPELYRADHPGVGGKIRWGSWGLNFYFTVKAGRSWKEATVIAARWLRRHCKIAGTTITALN